MAGNLYSHDAEWEVLRVSAAASVADNYAKMGTAVGSDAAEAGTTTTVINATAHSAVAGDIIVMTSGGEDGEAREVASVTANAITLSSALSGAPSATETFNILRPVAVGKNGGKLCYIKNTSNQDVFISFDGINDHIMVEAGEDIMLDLKASNLHLKRDGWIYVRTVSTAPTSGGVYVSIAG